MEEEEDSKYRGQQSGGCQAVATCLAQPQDRYAGLRTALAGSRAMRANPARREPHRPALAGPPQSRLWHLSTNIRSGFKGIYVPQLACQSLQVSRSSNMKEEKRRTSFLVPRHPGQCIITM